MICKDLNMITFVEFRWEEYDDYDGTDDLNSVDSRTCGRPSKSSPQEGENAPIRVYQKSLSKSGYGSIPIDTFLVGWTSIYQLFWGSLGTRVLTHPHLSIFMHILDDHRCNDSIWPWRCAGCFTVEYLMRLWVPFLIFLFLCFHMQHQEVAVNRWGLWCLWIVCSGLVFQAMISVPSASQKSVSLMEISPFESHWGRWMFVTF